MNYSIEQANNERQHGKARTRAQERARLLRIVDFLQKVGILAVLSGFFALGLFTLLVQWRGAPSRIDAITQSPLAPNVVDERLQAVIADNELRLLIAPREFSQAQIELGEALFFDKVLSGNRDISCATCHHPLLHTSDSNLLPVGTGGRGLGRSRQLGSGRELAPRNSPEIFNRGSADWQTLMWDGRIAFHAADGFVTPAGDDLPEGLDSVLAAQALFPITSRTEMRGETDDVDIFGQPNEIGAIPDGDFAGIWDAVFARVIAIPSYKMMFEAAYPGRNSADMGPVDMANAIAAYESATYFFVDAPWTRYLSGDADALSAEAKRGAQLFYGEAGCSECHSGPLLTDQQFYNIGIPQFGPGKDDAGTDFGRYIKTNDPRDYFAFRTPSLHNVALTGPWMHNGAYTELTEAVRHHLDAENMLATFNVNALPAELQETLKNDDYTLRLMQRTIDSRVTDPPQLTGKQFDDLLAFLHALSSPSAADLGHLMPTSVPSGLPISD